MKVHEKTINVIWSFPQVSDKLLYLINCCSYLLSVFQKWSVFPLVTRMVLRQPQMTSTNLFSDLSVCLMTFFHKLFCFLCLILWMWRYIQSQNFFCLQLFAHMHVVATSVVSGPQPYRLLHTDFRDWSLFLFFHLLFSNSFWPEWNILSLCI